MLFNNGDPSCIIFDDLSSIAVVIGIRNTKMCHMFERVSPKMYASGFRDIHMLFSQTILSATNDKNPTIALYT